MKLRHCAELRLCVTSAFPLRIRDAPQRPGIWCAVRLDADGAPYLDDVFHSTPENCRILIAQLQTEDPPATKPKSSSVRAAGERGYCSVKASSSVMSSTLRGGYGKQTVSVFDVRFCLWLLVCIYISLGHFLRRGRSCKAASMFCLAGRRCKYWAADICRSVYSFITLASVVAGRRCDARHWERLIASSLRGCG